MAKRYTSPKRRGPVREFPGGRYHSVLLGDRERAMIQLYCETHLGGAVDVSAALRAGLELLCAEFDAAEIEARMLKEKDEKSV